MRDVTFTHDTTTLAGTVHPGSGPPVVLVAGSGPSDRDAVSEWIRGLHGAGLTVLAYDKPGCGGSGGDWREQTLDDRADEAVAAARFLAGQPEAGGAPVSLVGGSQGAWVCLLAAPSDAVAVIVCVSAAGVSVAEQELYRVAHQLPAMGFTGADVEDAVALLRERIDRMARGDDVERIHADEQRVADAPWMEAVGDTTVEELRFDERIYGFDPKDAIGAVRVPMLAIWGADDVLVPVEESLHRFLAGLGDADPRTQLVVVPNADHGLRVSGVEGRAPGLWDTIASWLRRVS